MLTSNHKQELKASGIDQSLWDLNWDSLDGSSAWDLIWQDAKSDRFAEGGRPRQSEKRKYSHLSEGGLWCAGCDPLNGLEIMAWGQLKPDAPRKTRDGKTIKYEAPIDSATRVVFLRVSRKVWKRVARRSGVDMPDGISPSTNGYGLQFWDWVRENKSIKVVPTEGTKKAGCLLSNGYVAIALPSVYNAFQIASDTLKPELSHFAQKDRPFTIAYDCDAKPKTRRSVARQTRKLYNALHTLGCVVEVASWNSRMGKGIDDYVANGGDLHAAIELAEPIELWTNRIDGGEISYPVHQLATIIDRGRRYLAPIAPSDDEKFVFIKAGKGLGKTEVASRFVSELCDYYSDRPVLILTHRVQLGRALATRFLVDYLDLQKDGISRFGGGFAAENGGLCLCVDSLHNRSGARFSPEWWRNAIVVIDECEQFVWHLLSSKTDVARNRPTIINNLSELLQNASTVIALDADLTDVSIDYLLELNGEKGVTPWIGVCDEAIATGRVAWIYEDHEPIEWFAALTEAIETGEKPFICLSGQKVNSKWGSQHLERRLSEMFPHLIGGRIDGESVATLGHEFHCCLDDLDPKLKNCDYIVVTGVIETGVSIDLRGHFTSVWACAWGLQTETGVRQFVERVRDDAPRHVWAKETSIVGRIENGSAYPSVLRRAVEGKADRAKTKAIEAKAKASDTLAWQLRHADNLTTRDNPTSVKAWSRFAARINAGMKYYRRSIVAGLRRDGYEIKIANVELEAVAKTELKEQLTESVEAFESEVNDRIAENGGVDSDTEFERLSKAREMTQGDRERLHHEKVKRRYGVEVTPDLIHADRRTYFSEISLHYFLTHGRQFVERFDNRKIARAGEYGAFVTDLARGLKSHKIEALEWLGLPELLEAALDPDRVFTNDDDDLHTLQSRAIAASRGTVDKAKRQIGRYLAKLRKMPQTPERDSMIAKYEADREKLNYAVQSYAREFFGGDVEAAKPLTLFKQLLRKLGLKMQGKPKTGYQLETIDDPRFEIFGVWLKDHQAQIEKWELEAAEELEADRERRASLEAIAKLEADRAIDLSKNIMLCQAWLGDRWVPGSWIAARGVVIDADATPINATHIAVGGRSLQICA